jgi:molybdate transport system ATP-binding protein
MTRGLVLDITLPLDRFTLALRWETSDAALGIFGPSGAGKTSILESIAGLRRNARGLIRVGDDTWLDSARGVRLPPERRGVGYVPQDSLLFPHRDVMGNIQSGRRRAEWTAARRLDPERVLEVLELTTLARRAVASLSGGERQRVALARALCSGPELLLLDEPLASLEQPLRRRILPYLFRIQQEFTIPTLYVSHDATEVTMLSREVMVLSAGQMVARGRPEEVFSDPSVYPVARAGGFENVLRGKVAEVSDATSRVDLEPGTQVTVAGPGLQPGREVMIAARAEDLILAVERPAGLSAQNVLSGVIREIREPPEHEGTGGQVVVVVTVGRMRAPWFVTITARASEQLALRPGLGVYVVCKANSLRVLATR